MTKRELTIHKVSVAVGFLISGSAIGLHLGAKFGEPPSPIIPILLFAAVFAEKVYVRKYLQLRASLDINHTESGDTQSKQ